MGGLYLPLKPMSAQTGNSNEQVGKTTREGEGREIETKNKTKKMGRCWWSSDLAGIARNCFLRD